MSMRINFKPIVAALGTFFILSMAVNPIVSAGENPSSLQRAPLSHFQTNKATVSYADLNLENEDDVQVLYQRLVRASKKVCGIRPKKIYGLSVTPWLDSKRCYRATLANAVEKFDNDDLIRIHAGKKVSYRGKLS